MYYDPGYGNYTLNDQWVRAMQMDPVPINVMQNPYDIRTNLPDALKSIEDAVKGETEDRLFYQYLISMAPTAQEKDIIAGIRDDEMKHYQMFRELYQEHTGNTIPSVQEMTFEKPASYCEGIRKALMGEQHAVAKYRRILYAMKDRRHINMLTEIITDELRHFGLYNYLYTKNKCTD